MKKQLKEFRLGATYKLRDEYVGHLWFTQPAYVHCMEKYGVQQHVFTGVCVRLNGIGGASLQLDDNNIFYAANDERHMFTRIDNK